MKKRLQHIVSVIRSQEWWEPKLSPLLAIGYATASFSGVSLVMLIPWLLFLLASIIVGAVYVSVINDLADMREDLASGKENRMAGIPHAIRWLIPIACVLLGFLFLYFFYPDAWSMLLYILPWISFSMYSFEPVRLKRRGVWGLFADASGSHLFISLLFVSSVSFFMGQQINWVWFTAIGAWAFCYGLRGILWHQFYDRENDRMIHLKTFATDTDPQRFKGKAMLLLAAEIGALTVLLYEIGDFLPVAFLMLYLLLTFVRNKWLGCKPVVVHVFHDGRFEIFMLDYYQGFFPLALLITAALAHPAVWIIFVVHVFLFPKSITGVLTDALAFIKKVKAFYSVKLQRS